MSTKKFDPIKSLGIDPEKAKKEKDAKMIVDSVSEGFARSMKSNRNSVTRASYNVGANAPTPWSDLGKDLVSGNASLGSIAGNVSDMVTGNLNAGKYDIGYSPSKGGLNQYRAGEQSSIDALYDRSKNIAANFKLGVLELAGHIIDSPEIIKGLIDGKDFNGEANNFDNILSKWAREKSEEINSRDKVYLKNPGKTWDLSDPKWYINNGIDTAESMLEFFATGAGVGKLVGSAAKGLSMIGKGAVLADMVGSGAKAVSKISQYSQKAITSLVTAESVASLNASQLYPELVSKIMRQRKDDGEFYTKEEAEKIAAENSAKTFNYTFVSTVALNITSLAPFLRFGKYTPKSKLKGSTKSIKEYSKSLKELKADPKRMENGRGTSSWWAKQLKPDSLLGEMVQEGTEEVLENVAQDVGKRGAAYDSGDEFSIDLFSEENGLAFALGAFGGGMGKAGGSAYKKYSDKGNKNEFDEFIDLQDRAIDNHINLTDTLEKLDETDVSDMSPVQYRDHKIKVIQAQNGLISNSLQKGLEDGTIEIIKQSIQNQIDLTEEEAGLAGVDQNRAKGLMDIINKHQKYVDNFSDDTKDVEAQRYATQASINKDLSSMMIKEIDQEIESELSLYSEEDKSLVMLVNELYALSSLEENSKLSKEERARKEAITKELENIDDKKKELVLNETIAASMYLKYNYNRDIVKSSEDFAKFNDPKRAHKAVKDAQAEESKIREENSKQVVRDVTIAQAEIMADRGDKVVDIEESMKAFKNMLTDKSLSEDDKKSYKDKYDKLKVKADKKIAQLKKSNLSKTNLSKSPEKALNIAKKMFEDSKAGGNYKLAGDELQYYNENSDLINKLFKTMLANDAPTVPSTTEVDPEDAPTDSKDPSDPSDPKSDNDLDPKDPGEDSEVDASNDPNQPDPISKGALTGGKPSGDNPSDGKIISEGGREEDPEPDNGPKETFDENEDESTDYTRGANTFLKEFASVPMTLEQAEAKVIELKAAKNFKRYHKIKLGHMIPQIEKINAQKKDPDYNGPISDTVWMPLVNDDFSLETERLALKGDPTNFSVKVTDVFETTEDGVLIANTQAVKVGDKIEIVYDKDWPYSMPNGVKPLLVYRVVDGKRSEKPMSSIPYSDKRTNPQAADIRERFEKDQSPMSASVESKNFGDLMRDRDKNGDPAQNELSAALGNSTMPILFGIVKKSEQGVTYQVTNYNNGGMKLLPSQKKAIETLDDTLVNQGDDTMTKNNVGQHFAIVVAPNGKVVPVYMKGSKLSKEDVTKLLDASDGAMNIARILRTGVGFEGKDKLKKLMSISSSSDSEAVSTLSTFKGNMLVTPTGLYWKTNLGSKIHQNASEGSWVRIDFKSPNMTKKKGNDGPNMLLKFLEGETTGVSIRLLNSKDWDYVEFKADYNYMPLGIKTTEESEIYTGLKKELEDRLTNAHNNIDQNSMNKSTSFVDAFGNDTGVPYNEWVTNSGKFTTDLTTADQKFTNITTYIKPDKEKSPKPTQKTDKTPGPGRIEIASETDEQKAKRESKERNEKYAKVQLIFDSLSKDFLGGNTLLQVAKQLKDKGDANSKLLSDLLIAEYNNTKAKGIMLTESEVSAVINDDMTKEEKTIAIREASSLKRKPFYDKKAAAMGRAVRNYLNAKADGVEGLDAKIGWEKSTMPGIDHTIFIELPGTGAQISLHGNFDKLINLEGMEPYTKGWDKIPGVPLFKMKEVANQILGTNETVEDWSGGIDGILNPKTEAKPSKTTVTKTSKGRVQVGAVDEKISDKAYKSFEDGNVKESTLDKIVETKRNGLPLSERQKEIEKEYKSSIDSKLEKLKEEAPSPDKNESNRDEDDDIDDAMDDIGNSLFGMHRSARIAPGSFKKLTQFEIDWITGQIGKENLKMVEGVDRIVDIGGQEAFGWFENAMVTLASEGEVGTAYHEAFHYVFHMALYDADKSKVFEEMRELVRKEGGDPLSNIDLEEKAAELFRDYMMNKENSPIKKKSMIGKFFEGLVSWINKMLGLGTDPSNTSSKTFTDVLFQDISSGDWKTKYADNFGKSVEPVTKRLRAIPNYSIRDQRESITDASARVLDIAENIAASMQEESGVRTSFEKVLSNKKLLDEVLSIVEQEYSGYLLDNKDSAYKALDRYKRKVQTKEDEETLYKYGLAKKIVSKWDITLKESKEDNPPTNFKNELIKSFKEYGFSVSSKVSIIENTEKPRPEGLEHQEDLEDNNSELSEKEYIYNQDIALKSTKASVSMALRRKLSLLPDYEVNDDNTVKIVDGQPVVKTTIFGTPKRQEFNKVYSNVKSALTDISMGDMMYERIKELSNDSPIFAAILHNLNEAKKNDQLGKFSDGFYADFMSSFSNSSNNMKTVMSGNKTNDGVPRVIGSDRGAIHFQIIDNWRVNANNLRLVDTSFLPNKDKWSDLLKSYDKEIAAIGKYDGSTSKSKREWESKASKVFYKYRRLIGMDVNLKVIQKAKKRNKGDLRGVLIGSVSFRTILDRGSKGVDPFGDISSSSLFAKPQAAYEDDVTAGSFHSGSKQYHSVNMPSFLTDLTDDIRNNDVTGKLESLASDPFYNPDPTSEKDDYSAKYTNLLLEFLMDPNNRKNFKIETHLEYNDGTGNSVYSELNFEDSFAQKMIGYTNGKKGLGSFSIGTLSDKLKTISLSLTKKPSLKEAKEFYIDAMKRTVIQESKRISLVKANPEFAKIFARGGEFVYVDGANDIAELTASISKGEITSDEFDAMYDSGSLDSLIKGNLDLDLVDMHNVLLKEGVLELNEDGEFRPSVNIKTTLGIHNGQKLMELIDSFLLTDKIWKMEISKITMGDYAKYPGFSKYFKRMYQPVTNGRRAFVGTSLKGGMINASQKSTHSRLIIKSPHEFATKEEIVEIAKYTLNNDKNLKEASKYIDEMFNEENAGKETGDELKSLSPTQIFNKTNEIKKALPGKQGEEVANAVYIAYAYRDNNVADAAAYCSIDFYRDQMLGLGQWGDDQEWIFNNAWNKGITVEEAVSSMKEGDDRAGYYKKVEKEIFASTLKPFFYGQREVEFDDENGNKFTHIFNEQFKESISPILPIWGKKIGGFSYLLDQFKNNKVDVASTNDGVKVGIIEDQEASLGDPNPTVRRKIPTSNLRYPQVPAKMKNSAKAAIQFEKIIMANLSPKGVYKLFGENKSDTEISESFHDTWNEKILRSKDKVLNDLAFGDGVPYQYLKGEQKRAFLMRLRGMVEDAVIAQGLPDAYLEALNIERVGDNDWDYELGLDFEPYARTYQNILLSYIKKGIVVQKLPGGAMVNMGDLAVETDDELKFVTTKNGKIVPAEIAITLSNSKEIGVGWGIPSIKLDKEGNSVGPTVDEKGNVLYNNLLPWQKKGLDIVLYRIPVQMKSSAVPTRVKRILPIGDGAKVILPGRMTTQAGLDFDFDKSFFMIRHPGEENAAPRDGKSLDDFSNNQLDNHIFDIHWEILNNMSHFEELMTPISSRSHDDLLAEKGVSEDMTITEDPFSITSNIQMEGLAKHSQSGRGSASDFASGHNVLVNIATMGPVSDYITISRPIRIRMNNGYEFNELGRQKDAHGKYISENHSENLNSFLDSQADPKLGKLNVSTFNYAVNGYMNSLGVPDRIVKLFMNTPAILSLANNYFKVGGVPYNIKIALNNTIDELGIKDFYYKPEKKAYYITEDELETESFRSRDGMDPVVQATVLRDFMNYFKSARELASLNNLLKSDGWSDSDAASIRVTLAKHESLFNEATGTIKVSRSLFDTETSPIKRLASLRENGMELGIDLLSNVTPYFSDYFNDTIDAINKMQKNTSGGSWDTFNRLNELISLGLISNVTKDGKDLINTISPGFNERISLFNDGKASTMPERLQYMKDTYPHLTDNLFFSRLKPDSFNSRFQTQIIRFPSSASSENGYIIEEFERLLSDKNNPEVAEFAKDLIAYGLHTSGMSKNDHGFIQIIPPSFWKNSGVGSLMRDVKRGVKLHSDSGYSDEMFTGTKYPLMADKIIRHMVATPIVPNTEIKSDHYNGSYKEVLLPMGYDIMPKNTNKGYPPVYIKNYSRKDGKFNLYKFNEVYFGRFKYVLVDTLGEGNRLNEMFLNMGDNDIIETAIPVKKKKTSKVKSDPNSEIEFDITTQNSGKVGNLHGDILPEDMDGPVTIPSEVQTVSLSSFGNASESLSKEPNNKTKRQADNDADLNPMEAPSNVTTISSDIFKSGMAQLASEPSKEANQALLTKLDAFLSANGITTTIVESMIEKFGSDYNGIADAANNAIYLAKGVRGQNAKVEEVAHIYIESTLGTRQTQRMLDMVEGTEEYEAVKKAYSELYNNDEYKLKREAAAKILAKYLNNKSDFSGEGKSTLRRALEALMNMLKRLFGKMDPYIQTSEDIIRGIKIKKDSKNVNTGLMYKVDGDDVDIAVDDVPDTPEAPEPKLSNIEDIDGVEIPDKELVKIASSIGRKKFKNVSQIMEKAISSTILKINRMKKQGYDSDEISEVNSLLNKMRKLKDSRALLMYMENVDKSMSNMEKFVYNPNVASSLSLAEIDKMRTDLSSFNIIDDIIKYINTNIDIRNSDTRNELDKLATASLKRRMLIGSALEDLNKNALAPLFKALTAEEVTIEEVLAELDQGTGNVNTIDKWVRSGIDSRDLLVRTTHKLLQEKKQIAFQDFYSKMRSTGGFMDANSDYEKYAKKNNINITSMKQRNEQFITEEKGVFYLVNKDRGVDKYNKIMALDSSHPVRRYYESLESMLVSTQRSVFGEGKLPLGYEIPRIRKDTYERLTDNKGIGMLTSNIKDAWDNFSKIREDYDYDIRPKESYDVDENNNPIQTIPLYYIAKMESDEVSMDIASSIAMFAQNAIDYREMAKIKGVIGGIANITQTRTVAKSQSDNLFSGTFRKVKAKFGLVSQEKSSDANSNVQTSKAIDRFFYGELAQQGFKVSIGGKTFTANKIFDFLRNFSSSRIMGFNLHIPLSNALTGESQMIQEAIGGEFFTMEDWVWSGKVVLKEMAKIAADEFSTKNRSKMNGLIEFMNLRNDFKMSYNSLTEQRSATGGLYQGVIRASNAVSRFSETAVLAHSIGATASNIKVQDSEGNDIKFYDAIDMDNAEFKVKEGYTYKGKPLEDQIEKIRSKMIFVHQSMHGIYNQIDSPAMNAYIMGKQLSFMRGWLFQPLSRRFDTTRFSERTGGYREGTYMTMMKVLANTYGEGGFLSTQSNRIQMLTSPLYNKEKSKDLFLTEEEKKTMTEEQQDALVATRQANIRKSWAEISMIVLMTIAMNLLYDADEPEEDDNQFIRYHALRLKREMFFYSPFELLELHKNPAIAFAGSVDLLGLGWRSVAFWNWGEEDSKGKNIYVKKAKKMSPWLNQWYKWDDLKKQANAIENGFR